MSLNPWKLSAASYWMDPATGSRELRDDTISVSDGGGSTSTSAKDSNGDAAATKQVLATTITPTASKTQMLWDILGSEAAIRKYIWVGFLVMAWKLRSFYGIILGTFVLSYLGSSVVRVSMKYGNSLLSKVKLPKLPRRIWALSYVFAVVMALSFVSVLSVPRVVGETNYMSLVIDSDNPYIFVADGIRNFLGPEATDKLELFLLSITGEEGRNFATGVITAQGLADAASNGAAAVAKGMNAVGELGETVWTGARASRFAKLLEFSLKGYVKSAFYLCRKMLSQSTAVLYKGIISLLFSFMIVYDLPKLAEGAKSLRYSRLRLPYEVCCGEGYAMSNHHHISITMEREK